ncbi:hypothetical protein [Streptomyces sp. NPDC058434]|uniref:hypothetical protein n=1 Tax=Streptomyces sp. NPDC058434 TaxID=3346498 RepID=UPI00365E86FE
MTIAPFHIRRHPSHAVAGVAAVTLGSLAALTGCSNNDAPDQSGKPAASSSPTSSSSPSPSPSQTTDPNAQAVLAAYNHYWDAKAAAYAKASVAGTDLEKYAVGEARTATEYEVKSLAKKGFITTGQPSRSPAVTKVDLSKKVPSATVRDCVDVSSWKLVDSKTGSPVQLPKERRTKYISAVTAEKWNGQWVILRAKQEDQGC